jgi:Tfp pilus assembly protein PilW
MDVQIHQLGYVALAIGLIALIVVGGVYLHFKRKFRDCQPHHG